MDKVVNERSQWVKNMQQKWVKDMKQMKVVKRRGQNEHLNKATNKNKFIFYNNKTYVDT